MTKLRDISGQIDKALLQLKHGHVEYAIGILRGVQRDMAVIQSTEHIAQSFQAIGDAAQIAAKELEKFVAAARQVT